MSTASPPECAARPGTMCTWRTLGRFIDRSGKVGEVTLERCIHCGHGRSLPGLGDVAFLYNNRESQDFQPGTHGLAYQIKCVAFRAQAKQLIRRFGASAETVLDFGCGSGQFTRLLDDLLGHGHVTGSDFFPTPPPELSTRRYVPMTELGKLRETFDVVIAMHVLEHDDDSAALLARIVAPAKRGGTVVIEVPNVDCLWARVFGRFWDAWYLPFHRTHFSRSSLLALIERQGLTVVAVDDVVVPTMGRTFANYFGRRNNLFWLLLGVAAHPLQWLGEKLTGQPSAFRVTARKA